MKIATKKKLIIGFAIIFIIVQSLYWADPVTLSQLIELKDNVIDWIHVHPVISGILYVGIYILSILFGIPISITFVGGYLFGIKLGILYSLFAIGIGTTALLYFVRYVFPARVKNFYKDSLEGFNKELEAHGLYYVVTIHLIPFMPSFIPTVSTALTNIPLYKLITINLLGSAPLTIAYVVLGAYLNNVSNIEKFLWYISVASGLLGGSLLLFALYKKYKSDQALLKKD
ncbi:MAG: hypothetical protein CL947_01460 [Epsilonproteobacteria bacterium]|nr:hypothetical protein [Campylobacterota bacterium]